MSTSDDMRPHVTAARNLAACLEAAGVGSHPERGHVAILRRMANHIESEAAAGRKPLEFNDASGLSAAAGGTESRMIQLAAAMGEDPGLRSLLEQTDLMAAANCGESVSIYELDERLKKRGITGNRAIEAKLKLGRIGVIRRV